ncbi:LLM class flavin-dependent oxidoreductase [Cellulomonas sp. URHD0024]|uniref:LLM class flavin-dependent oxidoreductase n=1 Tax=Cellulomonas sp. URHD0024 TaxID=1302620 RepID=UPI00042A7302|nr:LLM class flavin-dependent oxidoreductase [Cellulomonas sp. URHD0024]
MTQFHLAVELTPAGLHPAAWRLPEQDAAGAFTARHWLDRARAAHRAGASLVFVDDSAAAPLERPGRFVGSLDAVGIAALLGPTTSGIGLAPVVPVTYREPFHVGKEIQTLDHVSLGRGAVQIDVAAPALDPRSGAEALRYDERVPRELPALWREAEDTIEVLERLWDSWEDDAIILDEITDRYIDRDKVHAIEFTGEFFSVQGASITPRSPQGRAVVVIRGDEPNALAVASRRAQVIRVRTAQAAAAARSVAADATVLLDVDVLVAPSDEAAAALRATLDAFEPWTWDGVVVGGPETVAGALTALAGSVDGVTVRPVAGDVALLEGLLPLVEVRATLRETLGLPRPTSRYAAAR